MLRKPLRRQLSGFERASSKWPIRFVVEVEHAGIGVLDHEPLAGPERLLADDEARIASSIGAAASISYHMGVALGEARVFRRVEAGVHTGEEPEASRQRQRQVTLVAEIRGVSGVDGLDLVLDSG